mmetsp:Transcript_26864/g.76935  ORF Transcript_26864/g.76935 Transcript_26864/m.76935 type:complete len:782 (+) Transcript_26864:965-3310(+)
MTRRRRACRSIVHPLVSIAHGAHGLEGRPQGAHPHRALLVVLAGRELDLAGFDVAQGLVRLRKLHVAILVGRRVLSDRRLALGSGRRGGQRKQLLLQRGLQHRCGLVQRALRHVLADALRGLPVVVHVDLEGAGADGAELTEDDVLGDRPHVIDLVINGGVHQDLDGLLEGALHPRAHVRSVDAVARDGHQVAAVAHHVAHRTHMSVVYIRAVERDDHADVEEEGLPRGLDTQHLQDLHDVVALQALEIHFWEQHHLLHVDTICVQHPLLVSLELTLHLVVLVDRLLAHEDLLDADDALQGHLLEDVCLDASQELEVFVLLVVVGVEGLCRLADVRGLFEEADAEHQLLGIVVREDAVDVAEEVVLDALADLSDRQLLVGHDLVAELDAQDPGAEPVRVTLLVRQLVILLDPLLVLLNPCVHGVGVPEDLGEGRDLLQRRMLEHTLHVLGTLLLLAEVAREEDRQRRGPHRLRHVDDLLQTRHAEGHVLGTDAGEVEGVESHLRGRLPDTLGGQDTDGLSWMCASLHEALLDLSAEPIEGLLCQAILHEDLLGAQVAADVGVEDDLRVVLHLAADGVTLGNRPRHFQLRHQFLGQIHDLPRSVLLLQVVRVLQLCPHLRAGDHPGDVDREVLLVVTINEHLLADGLLQLLEFAPLCVQLLLHRSIALDVVQDICRQPVDAVLFAAVVVLEGVLKRRIVVGHDLQSLILDPEAVHAVLAVKELDDVLVRISGRAVVGDLQGLHGLHQASLNVPGLRSLASRVDDTFSASHGVHPHLLGRQAC